MFSVHVQKNWKQMLKISFASLWPNLILGNNNFISKYKWYVTSFAADVFAETPKISNGGSTGEKQKAVYKTKLRLKRGPQRRQKTLANLGFLNQREFCRARSGGRGGGSAGNVKMYDLSENGLKINENSNI